MKNFIRRIHDPITLVAEHWTFFDEGMTALNDPKGAKANYSREAFFRLLCRIMAMDDKGFVFILESKNEKPLAFCIAFEAVDHMADKCMFLVELYSNGKCSGAAKECIEQCKTYGRELGLSELKAATRRFSGSALRLFEDRWGFTRDLQTFTQFI